MIFLFLFCFYMTLNFGCRINDCLINLECYRHAEKIPAKVLYWEERMEFLHWYSFPVSYYLEVRTTERIYHLVTECPDAARYQHQEEIMLYKIRSLTDRMMDHCDTLPAPDSEEERRTREDIIQKAKEIDRLTEESLVIIQEEKKAFPDLLMLLFLAMGFGTLTVLSVLLLLKPYM